MSRIEQTIPLAAPADTLRSLIADSAMHSAFTGAPADIGAEPGSTWTAFGGKIEGRTLDSSPTQLVQAWRSADWPDGGYSLVTFQFADGTIRLVHDAVPDGAKDMLEQGWHQMYWEPMKAWLAAR